MTFGMKGGKGGIPDDAFPKSGFTGEGKTEISGRTAGLDRAVSGRFEGSGMWGRRGNWEFGAVGRKSGEGGKEADREPEIKGGRGA